MDIMTFYGRISFDTGEYYGRQKGHEMVYLQWQEKDGKLVKEVVWPEEAKSSDLVYPLYIKFGEVVETTQTVPPTTTTVTTTATVVTTKKTPGFEALFAIVGLLAVAYIMRRL